MTSRRESLLIPFLLLLLAALFISACTDQPAYEAKRPADGQVDWCGFTWKKTAPTAEIITIRVETDWQQYPGTCKSPGIRGCAAGYRMGGKQVADILLMEDPDLPPAPGQCDVAMHEVLHALGYTHKEPHSYSPRDYARRSGP